MEQPELFKIPVGLPKRKKPSAEYKIVVLRDCVRPSGSDVSDTPASAVEYGQPNVATVPVRRLQIEAVGDFWKGFTKPRIRLMGRWLERAGFTPGQHVHVTCVAPGVLELRAPTVPAVKPPPPAPSVPT